ncbi:MAG TPA: iron ABC transporter permease, partial [Thermomicrobiales bacterium]|nr:iron ABC transporter permease [Thermomicrobiales bacterium]
MQRAVDAKPPGGRTRGLALPARLSDSSALVVLLLAAVVLLLIVGYPLLWLILGAAGLPGELTLENFRKVATQPTNIDPLKNTLELALGTAIVSVVLGVPLAWATARTTMPLRRVIQALVALAYITPPYLTSVAYIILLGPNAGHINRLLVWMFGLDSGPLNVFSMGGVIFVISLHVFAFPYFLTYSALQSLDAPLEESAQMLGASRWTTARRVTLPLVAPAITGGALLAAVESMALFGPQAFLGLPAQIVFLPTRIYGVLGGYPPRWGHASALSLILVILTVIGLTIQRGYLERRSYTTISGRGVRTQRVDLGGWKWVLLAFCGVVVFFAAIAPVAVLVQAAFSQSWIKPFTPSNMTLSNFRQALFDDQVAKRGIVNSFKLAFGAAVIAVIVGFLIAYIDLRTRVRGRRLLDYLAILPLGLPGTVMAVGILLAFIRPPFQIYGTIWILLVAYVARFIPLAVRSANASLRQIDPSLEEAARISGAPWGHTIRSVLLPMMRPGLLAAWLLVFIPALSELSATILLYSSGTETISVAIFRLRDLGQLEVISALSVFTIAVILVVSL